MPRLASAAAVTALLAVTGLACSGADPTSTPTAPARTSAPATTAPTPTEATPTPTAADATPTAEATGPTTATDTAAPTAPAAPTATAAAEAGGLTPPGTELGFGEAATVPYDDADRTSTLEVTVHAIEMGSPEDLADFNLEPDQADDTPYYVPVTVTNVGTGDLSEASFLGISARVPNATLSPLIFFGTFDRCPRTTAPTGFTNGVSFDTCFTYLVDEGTVEAVVWDYIAGDQAQYFHDPIVWPAA